MALFVERLECTWCNGDIIGGVLVAAKTANGPMHQRCSERYELQQARNRIEAVRQLHQRTEDNGAFVSCGICEPEQWPCATVRALDGES